MTRLLNILEISFLITFWWQTRVNLLRWFPSWRAPEATIDYLIPFLYLSDILFLLVLLAWSRGTPWRFVTDAWRRLSGMNRIDVVLQPATWWILLLVIAAISMAISGSGAWGWYRWFKLLEAGLIGVWIWARWRDPRRRMLWGGVLLAGLAGEGAILVGEWLLQRSLGLQWIGEWIFAVDTPGVAKVSIGSETLLRPMATFAHPNIAAGIMAASLPLAVWWYQVAVNGVSDSWAKKAIKWLSAMWICIVAAALFVTFSRAAWSVTAGLMLIWGIYRWRRGASPVLKQGEFWPRLVAWPVVIIVGLGIGPLVVGRFETLATSDSWSWSLRAKLSDVAGALWAQHPWVGVGLNSFTLHVSPTLFETIRWQQPVHSLWLLVLAELGGMGLLAVSGLCLSVTVWIFLMALVIKRLPISVAALGLCWTAVLLLGLVDHYWWTSQQGLLALGGLVGGSLLVRETLPRPDIV